MRDRGDIVVSPEPCDLAWDEWLLPRVLELLRELLRLHRRDLAEGGPDPTLDRRRRQRHFASVDAGRDQSRLDSEVCDRSGHGLVPGTECVEHRERPGTHYAA